MFSVDDRTWTLPCDIKESINVHSTNISGELLNGQYFNDVDGTFLSYTVQICPNPQRMGEYYELKTILAQPVDGHEFIFPYLGGTVQITGRVSSPIEDIWVRMPGGGVYWKGIKFIITSNGPTYVPDLNKTIQRGLTPLPDVVSPQIGDTYTYTVNGWARVNNAQG